MDELDSVSGPFREQSSPLRSTVITGELRTFHHSVGCAATVGVAQCAHPNCTTGTCTLCKGRLTAHGRELRTDGATGRMPAVKCPVSVRLSQIRQGRRTCDTTKARRYRFARTLVDTWGAQRSAGSSRVQAGSRNSGCRRGALTATIRRIAWVARARARRPHHKEREEAHHGETTVTSIRTFTIGRTARLRG